MITLITGAPGAGKTALLVEWLRTLYKDRPLYVHGLNGLKLEHIGFDANKWHQEVPDGAIVVIDEVQQVWRPRGPGHAPAPSVQALEVHRHRGIDFFITTQKPNLLDANVRGLVGRHVHLRDTGWLGRHMYEWPECSDNLAWKTCPLKRKFKLPREAFTLYKSASEHTTVQKGRSWMPLITLGLVALTIGLIFGVWRAVQSKTAPDKPPAGGEAVPYDGPERTEGHAKGAAPGAPAGPTWPKLINEPQQATREPYADRAFQIEGEWTVGREPGAVFGLIVDGKRIATVSLVHLVRAGYTWKSLAPCSGSLQFGTVERLITCGPPSLPSEAPRMPLERAGNENASHRPS